MYKSNVWTVLPQLQNLALGYASPCPIKEDGIILYTIVARELKKFTRDTYTWETEKYGQGIQDLLERIKSCVMAEEAVKTEREILERTENKVRLGTASQREIKEGETETTPNFDQVFPFLVPFLANSDLMACRLVSKAWKSLVGDQYRTSADLPLSIDIPMTQSQRENFNRSKQNPYFAHNVHLSLNEGTDKAKEVQKLLQKLGTHIRHLTISSLFFLSLVEIYKIFTICIKSCTNLESLTLHITAVQGSDEKVFKKLVKATIPLALPKRFETLAIPGPDSMYRGAVLNMFLDKVKDKCRDKVTILRQDQSSKPKGEMSNLKELTIRKFSTDVGSQLHSKWRWPLAPNLNKLRICVTGQNISFRDLTSIVQNYPKLEFLEIQFTEGCGGFEECLKYCDPSKLLLKVTKMQIVLKHKAQICLDFLVLFPYVKSLTIMYGKHAEFYNEESIWQPQISYGDIKPRCSLPERKTENDYIQLVEYLKDVDLKEHDHQGIYSSNIWTVLRRLKELKLVCCATEQTKRDRSIFCRKM